jgi:hypothetical protein
VFQVYCDWTDIHPHHEHTAEKCKYYETYLCIDHVIRYRRLFDQLRYEAQMEYIIPPTFTTELVLDKIWCEKIQKFLKKSRLGFIKEFNHKLISRNDEENADTLMSKEFDVGTFE